MQCQSYNYAHVWLFNLIYITSIFHETNPHSLFTFFYKNSHYKKTAHSGARMPAFWWKTPIRMDISAFWIKRLNKTPLNLMRTSRLFSRVYQPTFWLTPICIFYLKKEAPDIFYFFYRKKAYRRFDQNAGMQFNNN